jgi:hypothetical protein
MDLLEIGLNVMEWIGLAQDRYSWRALLYAVMKKFLRARQTLGRAIAQALGRRLPTVASRVPPKFR